MEAAMQTTALISGAFLAGGAAVWKLMQYFDKRKTYRHDQENGKQKLESVAQHFERVHNEERDSLERIERVLGRVEHLLGNRK